MAAALRTNDVDSAPPGERRRRTRDHLAESALLGLGRRSADASIIDELIELAGVSRGTFYNHFRTNEELLAAAAGQASDELMRLVDPPVRVLADPAARIARGIRLVLTVTSEHPQFVRFVARVGPAALGAGTLAAEFVPRELVNLAAAPGAHDALLRTMSERLESAIAAEIGRDDGREMRELDGIDWTIDRIDL